MEIPQGSIREFIFSDSKLLPGTTHLVKVYRPAQYRDGEAAALYVSQDGMREHEPRVLDRLIAAGAMPVTVGVFVSPGRIPPTRPDGFERSYRCPEYDSPGPRYADFLIQELLPEVERRYQIRFAASSDAHAIGGCSSGGIAAFNAAWSRNDFFRRVYMSSPSFVAFLGGEALPVLVRKTETKPIRSFLTFGTDDMRNAAGDWHIQGLAIRDALDYAGYDFAFEVYAGGKHGAGFNDEAVFERAQRFLWQGFPAPVTSRHLPPRLADVVSVEHRWRESSEPMPPSPDSGSALSCDHWRRYCITPGSRHVHAVSLLPDGKTGDRLLWATLQPDFDGQVAASAIAADTADRLYVGTTLGVQLIDNNGHQQGILPLPSGRPVRDLRLVDSTLHALDLDGKHFTRLLKTRAADPDGPPQAPSRIEL